MIMSYRGKVKFWKCTVYRYYFRRINLSHDTEQRMFFIYFWKSLEFPVYFLGKIYHYMPVYGIYCVVTILSQSVLHTMHLELSYLTLRFEIEDLQLQRPNHTYGPMSASMYHF